MTSYEIVWEIYNKCPNNQMRDIFIEEAEVEDTDAYVKAKFEGKSMRYEKSVLKDGTIIYDLFIADMHERMSFQPF